MGATLFQLRRFRALVAVLFGMAEVFAGTAAAEYRAGQQVTVRAGATLDLLSASGKGEFLAREGTPLTLLSPRELRGNWAVAVLEDADGTRYYTSVSNLAKVIAPESLEAAATLPAVASRTLNAYLAGQAARCQTGPASEVAATGSRKSATPGIPIAAAPDPQGRECRGTTGHPDCGAGFKCDKTPLSKAERAKFFPWILDAVNRQNEINRAEGKLEIHPATILSFITAESSGNPLVTRSDGGKGLGQFTFRDVALKAGLDYDAPKPANRDAAFQPAYNQPLRYTTDSATGQRRPIYSVWSPKGTILAIASKLSVDANRQRFIQRRDASGQVISGSAPIDASTLYKGSDLLTTRYLAGYYNRQQMVINSVEEHFRQHGTLPAEYAQAWHVQRKLKATPAILFKECINRCHVEKIAGLCGSNPQGFFAEYSRDFVKSGGKWTVAG